MNGVGTFWLAAACQTDAGRVRRNNEDVPVCDAERGVFAVIDGVGGQSAGEVAAAIARRVMLDRLARPLGTPAERVCEAIALANNAIFKSSEESPEYEGMTCVLTLALVVDDRVTIGHVGDSRIYKLRPAGIRKLTHDHSPVGEREDAREITELEAMRHPRRNEVFRDVGSNYRDKDDDGFVEIVEDTIESDAALLLCTDGLSDMVPSSAIERVVQQHAGDPQAVVDALVSAANDAGGDDNITVVYAEAPEFARAIRAPGTYTEQVTIPDGVDLVARVPGKTTLTTPEHTTGDWRVVIASGGGRIAGIRITSKPDARQVVGIEISGADRRIELVDLDGPMRAAIVLTSASAVTIRGCTITTVGGPAIAMEATNDGVIANNTFVRAGSGLE